MNINEHNTLPLKKRILRIAMVYLIGFTLFFIVSLIIITLNVRTRQKVNIPPLVGKMYLEEHNNLMTFGLHIELQKANLVEYPYGYILAQSIASGEVVTEGTKLVLLINDSKSIVPVPNIVGSSESIAQKILENIPVGKASFSLSIGTITRIPSDKPAGEVLAQFPPPTAPVIPDSPVSILVSEGPEKLKTGYLFPDVRNVHIEIVKKMSYDNHIPIKVIPVQTYDFKKSGLIDAIDFGRKGAFIFNVNNDGNAELPFWTIHVKKYDNQTGKKYPNELIWINVEDFKFKGKAGTVFEKITDNATVYKNPGYAVLDKQWPVFYQSNLTLEAWEGYKEKDKVIVTNKIDDTRQNQNRSEHSIVNPDFSKKIHGVKI
ncbi:MAG: PASTA domain-containing protein [Spirochaetia bacterium]|nr:PASTA domain-containing protein [Spirochaetia bacterium]